ncbi:hypothetical protein RvY_13502 [Ramazzottius varieornatus]|uniref:Uncharacterized protein n=1 Tax=Ramazzottius varieornatus TaxID=947166 RepID=A0A1D1VPX4_RAMVA|nr:hypothetical protein RvY_13502 [Ramazzottius varieornatus]
MLAISFSSSFHPKLHKPNELGCRETAQQPANSGLLNREWEKLPLPEVPGDGGATCSCETESVHNEPAQ